MRKAKILLFAAPVLIGGSLLVAAPKSNPRPKIDGEEAYKANCMRCHEATRTYSPGMMITMMQHMRVRAYLTKDETEAILQYLLENSPSRSSSRKSSFKKKGAGTS